MSDIPTLIQDKLDIVDFLRQYAELKPAGKNFKANCPFHKEKTPSFMVSPERQSWHCFGACNEGGDIIKFLMKYENLEFYDALKILAEKAGVEIQTSGNRDFQANNNLYKVMEAAKEFFQANLTKSDFVRNYLKERGLKEETVQEFELGLAPDGSDVLTRHLLKLGYNIADIEKAGLAVKTERGTYWDRFRSRAIFPIHNHLGKVVAFTGRVLPGNENPNAGKYVNSPETPVFQKSKILYGFHKTKNQIREARLAVVVEGQMDFLMLWQDGVKNAVASSGTALTSEHLIVLRRLADELVLSFDADQAGQLAAERSIDLAGQHDFLVKLLIMEDKSLKDPADAVKSKPGLMADLIKDAKSAMDYYLYRYVRNLPEDLKTKKHNLRIMLSKIKSLSSPIDRSHWLKEVSELVNLEERVLAEEMDALSDSRRVNNEERVLAETPPVKENLSRQELILYRLLGVLLHMRSDLQLIKDHLPYFPDKYVEIYKNVLEPQPAASRPDLNDLMNSISLRFSFENNNFESPVLEKEAQKLLRELKIEHFKERRRALRNLIQECERRGDEEKLESARKEFNKVVQELENS